MVKNPPANVGDIGDEGSIPGREDSLGGGRGNLRQYSCLENPNGQRSLVGTVHRVAQSRKRLKRLSTHADDLSCNTQRIFRRIKSAIPSIYA